MIVREKVPLAPFTTFHIGGPAELLIEAESEEDVGGALALARERKLSIAVLGGGSNILVPDEGVRGMVLKITMSTVVFEDDGTDVLLIADAGALWDDVVRKAGERDLWGIENLAGIPGTVGGAAVQNIGAYGAELSTVFEYADIIESKSGVKKRITRADAAFAYRTSTFKVHPERMVMRMTLRLTRRVTPNLTYADLARVRDEGTTPLSTPVEVARAVRAIRATKFPYESEDRSAGSFFKNPVLTSMQATDLATRFPGLLLFPQKSGVAKLSLAWFLDHALSLKGYAKGRVRLYEKQPMVLIAQRDATAADVDALAQEVAERVWQAAGIRIEREVETFGVSEVA